jgi:tetratricopeptide (TPR) repeat protein
MKADQRAVNAAVTLARLGRYEDALPGLRHAFAKKPTNILVYGQLVVCLDRTRRFVEALEVLDAVLARKPFDSWAHRFRSSVLTSLGRHSEALVAAREGIRCDPNDSDSHTRLGVAAEGVGRYGEALHAHHQATTLSPQSGGAWRALSAAASRAGHNQMARCAARRALEIDPAGQEWIQGYAWVLEGERAVDLLRRSIAMDPADFWHFAHLAKKLCELRRYDEALRAVEGALGARNPRHRNFYHVACYAVRAGRTELARAREILETATQQLEDPGLWAARWVLLGWVETVSPDERAVARADALARVRKGVCAEQWLVDWLICARCYAEAYEMARELLTLPLKGEEREHAERSWIAACQYHGRTHEALAWFRSQYDDMRCPAHLAESVYWGFKIPVPALALLGADMTAARTDWDRWRARAAAMRAKMGEPEAITPWLKDADDPSSCAEMYWACVELKRFEEADAMADHLLRTAVRSNSSLVALYERALRYGALAVAQRVVRLQLRVDPSDHRGAEHRAELAVISLDVTAALQWSEHALDQGPHCAAAFYIRSLALVLAERFEEARGALTHALGIDGVVAATMASTPDFAAMVMSVLDREPAALDAAWKLRGQLWSERFRARLTELARR